MGTEEPPLLGDIGRLRRSVAGPLLISHAFRTPDTIEAALAAGADLVGMARALIADPDMPRKLLGGRAADIRPCVACNEDCRAFDPVLLCSVNPELGPPGTDRRPAAPLVVRRAARARRWTRGDRRRGTSRARVRHHAGRPPGDRAVRRARRDRRAARRRGGGSSSQRVASAAGLLRGGPRARGRRRAAARDAGPRGRPRRLRRGRDRDRQHRAPARPAGHRARAAIVVGDRPAPQRAQSARRGRRVRLVAVRERRRGGRPRGLRVDHGGDAGRGLRRLAAPRGPRAAARAPARRSARGPPVHGARRPRRGQRGAEEHVVRRRGARAGGHRHRGRRACRARLGRAGPGRGHASA